MKQNIAYRYRIYPDKAQTELLQKTFGCARFIWNRMLADEKEQYEKDKTFLNLTPAKYKKEYEWLKEVDSLALCNVQLQLKKAFQNHLSDGKRGYPKFKSKHRSKRSYTTNLVNGNIVLGDKTVRLPKVGEIRIRKHRDAPEEWNIKSVTVTQEASGKYYASVLYEYESQVVVQRETEKAVGLDFTMSGLYTDSEGLSAEMPQYYRKSEKRLREAQRKLSKKYVKGAKKQSNRYFRQKKRVAILQEKVRHQRADFLHKKSRELVDRYDCIGIEDLNMQGMSRTMNFGKSVNDNGWGIFTHDLSYKGNTAGKHVIKVDRGFPSSQMCHVCGALNPEVKNLKIREWDCPCCREHHLRDVNAAINLKKEALRIAALQ